MDNQELFLQALNCALRGELLPEQENVTAGQWQKIFELAQVHQVLPLVFQAVYSQKSLQGTGLLSGIKAKVRQSVFVQMRKTMEFLDLYGKLREAGVTPLVVKGLICRNLYPQPDQRPSADEDLLILPEHFGTAHRVLLDFGMAATGKEADFDSLCEIPYRKAGSGLYIELHRSLFPTDSGAYGHLNRFFEGVHQRSIEEPIQGAPIRSMAPTDHLFYLICHAFKHFLHSGFGIRQVCDIVLYANHYGGEIDWEAVLNNCRAIRCERFAAALFRIGQTKLCFDPDKACFPALWREILVDEGPMLRDLLSSGIYGGADSSRLHSSTITLTAMENQTQGKSKGGLVRSLFPEAKMLEGRYPYLKKHPGLLPVAWASRIIRHGVRSAQGQDSTADSIRIGRERVALLKQYEILDE